MSGLVPQQVERRLIELSKELDVVVQECTEAEQKFHKAKGSYEIGMARARLAVAQSLADYGAKATVQEKEDHAILDTVDEMWCLSESEVLVKAARQNVNRIRTQVDIARSVAASVRSSMEM